MALKTEMLRYFVTVARSGNLVEAAEKLGRTPSAVSMMLKQMEEHLGANLFESDRKSKLTSLGRFTLEQATSELAHFDRTISAIENYAQAKAGIVRIAVVPSAAETILPDVITNFSAQHPDVHIDIRDMDSASVLREIELQRVDVGIATGLDSSSEIIREPLISDNFGIVCHPNHPLTKLTTPLSWNHLKDWPFITNGICGQITDNTVQAMIAKSTLMVHNTTSLISLIKANVGITVLPNLVTDNVMNDLAFLSVNEEKTIRQIDLLTPPPQKTSPAAIEFCNAVRDVARNRAHHDL